VLVAFDGGTYNYSLMLHSCLFVWIDIGDWVSIVVFSCWWWYRFVWFIWNLVLVDPFCITFLLQWELILA